MDNLVSLLLVKQLVSRAVNEITEFARVCCSMILLNTISLMNNIPATETELWG